MAENLESKQVTVSFYADEERTEVADNRQHKEDDELSDVSSATPTDEDIQRMVEELEAAARSEAALEEIVGESTNILVNVSSIDGLDDPADGERAAIFEDRDSDSSSESEGPPPMKESFAYVEEEIYEEGFGFNFDFVDTAEDEERGKSGAEESRRETLMEEPEEEIEEEGFDFDTTDDAAKRSRAPSGTRRRKMMIYFTICACFVLILQGIIIAFVMQEDDEGNSDIGNKKQNTAKPTMAPSDDSITKPPISSAFQSIAFMPGVQRLDRISDCLSCAETLDVPSDKTFVWDIDNIVASITVGSDGFLSLDCQFYSICGRIDVVSTNLSPYVSGDIYVLWEDFVDHGVVEKTQYESNTMERTSLVISWEDVMIYGYWGDEPYRVNAQARISSSTDIEICFGEGDTVGAKFRSGVLNYQSYNPAIGNVFDTDGYTSMFPSNSCQKLQKSNVALPTSAPYRTPSPSSDPSEWPSDLPTSPANVISNPPTTRPTFTPAAPSDVPSFEPSNVATPLPTPFILTGDLSSSLQPSVDPVTASFPPSSTTATPSQTSSLRVERLEVLLLSYKPLNRVAFNWLLYNDTWVPSEDDYLFFERYLLAIFYFSTAGKTWTTKEGWLSGSSVCQWHGIVCNSDEKVEEIVLPKNEIAGTLPLELFSLVHLLYLNIESNDFIGTVASEIEKLTSLQKLLIGDCRLSGTIPTALFILLDLMEFDLSGNVFTGTIPTGSVFLPSLGSLDLSGNKLTGTIPSQLGTIANLKNLQLQSNKLTGEIPPQLGTLRYLEELRVEENNLSGTVPNQICDLTIFTASCYDDLICCQ